MGMSGKLLRPAGRFTPKSISGLAAWWDADSTSSLTLDGSGNVSQWNDLSGNGVHATQGTANNRPTPTAAGLNGRQVVTFDGSNDSLAFTGTARTDETIFVVCRQNVTVGAVSTGTVIGGSSSNFGIQSVVKDDGANSTVAWYLGGFSAGTTAVVYTVPKSLPWGPVVASCVRSAASGGAAFESGTAKGTCTTSNSFSLGRLGDGSSAPLKGYLAEVCIYSRALTATERQKIERYLGTKWGLSVA